jgi:asparagine synthase (glutamine-hydrolysing)
MCGIAGWISNANAPEESVLGAMLGSLAHRNGEEERMCAVIDRNRKREVVLGASLCDAGSRVSLALDGAILNARSLRAELEKRNYPFKARTDAELVLRAYQHWDKDLLKHLRGPFALALWDGRKDRLLLARDRFGEKPLYLHERGGALYFASEAKALLKTPGFRTEVDLQAMWDCVSYRYVPGPRTLFSGVRKLPPATYALWTMGRLQEVRYWFPPDRDPRAPAQTQPSTAGFVSQLEEAVNLRAPGSGVFLSGGLDSAAMVAVLSRQGGVRTFTLGFEGAAQKEGELAPAAEIAKHFATDHAEVVVAPRDLIPALAGLVAGRDAPVSRPSELAIHHLSAVAARSVKTVLTGDGCDEVLGGYRRHVAERFAWGFCSFPGTLALLSPLLRTVQLRTAVASLRMGDWRERYVRWNGTGIQDGFLNFDAAKKKENRIVPPFDANPRTSALRRALYFDQMSWLPDELLERNDRAAAGLQLRMPFLDHQLVQYISALPDDQRVRGLATKWILRQAGKELIPGALARRRKAGFRMPIRDWLRNDLRDTLLDHLKSGASRTRKYYDAAILDRMLDEHLEGKSNHELPLWTLLNLEIWHRQYAPA